MDSDITQQPLLQVRHQRENIHTFMTYLDKLNQEGRIIQLGASLHRISGVSMTSLRILETDEVIRLYQDNYNTNHAHSHYQSKEIILNSLMFIENNEIWVLKHPISLYLEHNNTHNNHSDWLNDYTLVKMPTLSQPTNSS